MRQLIVTLLLVVILAAGCASTFDREGTIDEFMESGLDRSQATCAVDEMVDRFGEDKLMSDDDATAEETEALFEIMTDCLIDN